jgi:hypothetical protein
VGGEELRHCAVHVLHVPVLAQRLGERLVIETVDGVSAMTVLDDVATGCSAQLDQVVVGVRGARDTGRQRSPHVFPGQPGTERKRQGREQLPCLACLVAQSYVEVATQGLSRRLRQARTPGRVPGVGRETGKAGECSGDDQGHQEGTTGGLGHRLRDIGDRDVIGRKVGRARMCLAQAALGVAAQTVGVGVSGIVQVHDVGRRAQRGQQVGTGAHQQP